jgi:hypothetical protein
MVDPDRMIISTKASFRWFLVVHDAEIIPEMNIRQEADKISTSLK